MSDQAGLFDLPDPVPPRPPTRSGRGRARDTFARTVVADVSVEDAGALRAEASRALDHTVVIGETTDAENDDLPDLREEISTSPAAAVQWCVEPTIGMGPSLESGAVRIDMIDHSAEEKSAGLVRVAWTVTVKILDAAAVRELALTACPDTDVATQAAIPASPGRPSRSPSSRCWPARGDRHQSHTPSNPLHMANGTPLSSDPDRSSAAPGSANYRKPQIPLSILSARHGSLRLRSCWGDVLVQPEHVGGVVDPLQFGESRVVVSVGCADAFLALGAQVVDVRGAF